jgi:hypothetical protein
MIKTRGALWLLPAATLLASPLAYAGVGQVLNSVSVYGNLNGVSNDGGQTTGGLGVKGSLWSNNLLLSANYHHDFGSSFAIPDRTGGGNTGVNVKLGYIVPVSNTIAFGPYLAYQYQRWTVNGPDSSGFHLANNAIGGGGMVAASLGPLTLTGNIGYLAGVSATYSYTQNGYKDSFTTAQGSDNVLQFGGQASLDIFGPVYAFAGLKWDRYMNHGALNVLQGNVGAGFSF